MSKDVSVLMVNYHTAELCEKSIASVYEMTHGCSFEIIVVDNASYDGLDARLRDRFPKVRFIQNDVNVGFGRANNLAARDATGKYLFMLNPDTSLKNDAISLLFNFMEEAGQESIGAVGVQLEDQEGNPIHSAAPFKKPLKELIKKFRRLLKKALFMERVSIKHTSKKRQSKEPSLFQPVDYVTGADLFMRRELFEQIGGYDEAFFLYYEETELQNRLAKSGFKRGIVAGGRIVHHVSASLSDRPTNWKRMLFHISEVLYMKKVYGPAIGRLYQIGFTLLVAVESLIDLYRFEFSPKENMAYIKALIQGRC